MSTSGVFVVDSCSALLDLELRLENSPFLLALALRSHSISSNWVSPTELERDLLREVVGVLMEFFLTGDIFVVFPLDELLVLVVLPTLLRTVVIDDFDVVVVALAVDESLS